MGIGMCSHLSLVLLFSPWLWDFLWDWDYLGMSCFLASLHLCSCSLTEFSPVLVMTKWDYFYWDVTGSCCQSWDRFNQSWFLKQNFLKASHFPHLLFPQFLASLVPADDRSGGEIEVKVVHFGTKWWLQRGTESVYTNSKSLSKWLLPTGSERLWEIISMWEQLCTLETRFL